MTSKILKPILITLILAAILFYPFYRGFDIPYTANADAEAVYISQALLFNSRLEQTYFDHTGYLAILMLSIWFKFSRLLGIIPLDNMIYLGDSQAPFGWLFAPLVNVTHILLIFLAVAFVLIFIIGLYLLTKKLKLALFAGLILATTQGIAIHMLGFRPELISAMFFMLMLMCALLFAQEEKFSYQAGLVFLASLFAYAALLTKYQIIFGILCIPLIALLWNKGANKLSYYPKIEYKDMLVVGFVFSLISWPFLYAVFNYLVFDIRFLHILIAVYLSIIILSYHLFRIKSWKHTVMLILSGFSGISVAFSYNLFNFDSRNTISIFYFFEYAQPYITGEQGSQFLWPLLNNFGITLLDKVSFGELFFQYSSALIYLIALLLLVFLAWRRQFNYSLQTGSLLALALLLETVFRLRYMSSAYYIYTEFLVLMSIFLALARLQSGNFLSKRNMYLIHVGLSFLAILFFAQNITAIDQNNFPAVINIAQPHEMFCGMGYFTPAMGELINYKDPEACVQILTEGCSPRAEISSCR